MPPDRSLKMIKHLSTAKRFELAQEKASTLHGLFLSHMETYYINRRLAYTETIGQQVSNTRAAICFNRFREDYFLYQLMRLCTFWDDVDIDGFSIPTVACLADDPAIRRCVFDIHHADYVKHEPEYAIVCAKKHRRLLSTAVRDVNIIRESEMLTSVRNVRDKIAHSILSTRLEQKREVKPAKFGNERFLFERSITAIDRLCRCLTSTGFSWSDSKKMHRRNADALWSNLEFKKTK